jgi:hypothetical protein
MGRTGAVPVDIVLQAMIALRQMQGATAKIDGDSAIINVEIPPALIQAVPGGIQQVLTQWSGKPIHFQLRDGAWRIDVDRSIRLVLNVQRKKHAPVAPATDREQMIFFEDQARDCDSIAKRISGGKLPHVAAAEQALQSSVRQVCMKLGIMNFSSYTAPANVDQP